MSLTFSAIACWLNPRKMERSCIMCPEPQVDQRKMLRGQRRKALLGRRGILGQVPRSAVEMRIQVGVTHCGALSREKGSEGSWRRQIGAKQGYGVSRSLLQPDFLSSSGSVSSTTGRVLPRVAHCHRSLAAGYTQKGRINFQAKRVLLGWSGVMLGEGGSC